MALGMNRVTVKIGKANPAYGLQEAKIIGAADKCC